MTITLENIIDRLENSFKRIEKAHNHIIVNQAKEQLSLLSDLETAHKKNKDLEEKVMMTKQRLDHVIGRLNMMLTPDEQEDAA